MIITKSSDDDVEGSVARLIGLADSMLGAQQARGWEKLAAMQILRLTGNSQRDYFGGFEPAKIDDFS